MSNNVEQRMNSYGYVIEGENEEKPKKKPILQRVQEQIAKRKSFSYNGKPVELSSE